MTNDALQTVNLRNNFYRDNYRKVVTVLLVLALALCALLAVVYYLISHPPKPTYFATTSDGRIIPLVPLNEPHVDKTALLQFASEAAMNAYTFDFINYRKNLQDSQQYFTDHGWQGFIKDIQTNLEAVKQKQLIVQAVPGGAPVIVQQGLIGYTYAWKVQMPLLVTYTSSSQTFNNSLIVTMLITRVSTLDTPRGILVDRINYEMAR